MYELFSYCYDEFMDDIPYGEWCAYLTSLLKEYGVDGGLVAELGCGTGNMTWLLANEGYDMIGIDNSPDMLYEAQRKMREYLPDGEPPVLYLLQDMRSFELFGTVKAIVSICDSMNYMLEDDDIEKVFLLAENYLDPGGVFIFDMKTDAFYRTLADEGEFCDVRDNQALVWENFYDADNHINTYQITLFLKREGNMYERADEEHMQRAYSIDRIKHLAGRAGLKVEAVYDAFTHNAPGKNSQRVYFVLKEQYREGKLYTSGKTAEI